MGIVVFSGLSEGSSYVFSTVGLNETYVSREGTDINIGLFPTFTGREGVKSYLDLSEINNMVSSDFSLEEINNILSLNAPIIDKRFDTVGYTSKFILITNRFDLVETKYADVIPDPIEPLNPYGFTPGPWFEYKNIKNISPKKIGNQVPDLINAYHSNTPLSKTVIMSKFDDSIKVLDPLGETLYHYKLESGSALSVIAMAANDEFIFFLRWKGTLSTNVVLNSPEGTGWFNDFYEIDQRHIYNGTKVVFEWFAAGPMLSINLEHWGKVGISSNCTLESSLSCLYLNSFLDYLNGVKIPANLTIINNAVSSDFGLVEVNNSIQLTIEIVEYHLNALSSDGILTEIDNYVLVGISLEDADSYVSLSMNLACIEMGAGYFAFDHNAVVYFRPSISLNTVDSTNSKYRTFKSDRYARDIQRVGSTIEKIRPSLAGSGGGVNPSLITQTDNTNVYNIRLCATDDGLFILGSDPNYEKRFSLAYVGGDTDQLPCYEDPALFGPDPDLNINPKSFICEYDLLTKWPKSFASQIDRVGYLGFFVNKTKISVCYPETYMYTPPIYPFTPIVSKRITLGFYEYKNNKITSSLQRAATPQKIPRIVVPTPTHPHKKWAYELNQRDGYCKWNYNNGLAIGYSWYVERGISPVSIVNPKGFLVGDLPLLSQNPDYDYTVDTPSFLAFHIVSFPNFINTRIMLAAEAYSSGLNISTNLVAIYSEGLKISSFLYDNDGLRLGAFALEDSNGGVRIDCKLAHMGYREKVVLISNSGAIAASFVTSRNIYEYYSNLSDEEIFYHTPYGTPRQIGRALQPSLTIDKNTSIEPFKSMSNYVGTYPQNLTFWTRNEKVPTEIIFDFLPLPGSVLSTANNYHFIVDFYAKNISGVTSACLFDTGLYADKIGENVAIGYIQDNNWFIRTTDGKDPVFISLGALPTNSWDYYCITISYGFSGSGATFPLGFKNIFKIYKNGLLLSETPLCLSRFGNNKVTIGKNSKTNLKIKGSIDQFRCRTLNIEAFSCPSSIYDPSDPDFDHSDSGLFCLNGESGVVDETDTYKVVNYGVKAVDDFYVGSKSIYFDSNSYLNVDLKQYRGVGWGIVPDTISYKKSILFNLEDITKLYGEITSWEGATYCQEGDYAVSVIPPVPVHFEVDSDSGFVFGIYNKYDDDFSYSFYSEQVGGYYPFREYGINYDNDGSEIIDLNDTPYSDEFYDSETNKLAVTRFVRMGNSTSNKVNYLPTGRLFRTNNLNKDYDKEVNLPIRLITSSITTYWFNYRKIGLDKTNKRLFVIRVKGGLDFRGYYNGPSDLTEEARNLSTYDTHIYTGSPPEYPPYSSIYFENYFEVTAQNTISDPIYVVNTYTNRDILIYNYELGLEDQIDYIKGLDEDDVICHIYEKNAVYYILTQVKEPEPAVAEDFFDHVLLNQTPASDNIHFYKYTRYTYKKTRIYKVENDIKQTAELFYEFDYSASSLDNIMIQEITDTHIWLNWDGVGIADAMVFNGVAITLNTKVIKEVPFLQAIYYDSTTSKWEIMLRNYNDDNRISAWNQTWLGSTDPVVPNKLAKRLPSVGNPTIPYFSDRYTKRVNYNLRYRTGHYGRGPFADWPVDYYDSFDFALVQDEINIYDEETFKFLRTEKAFQEIPEPNRLYDNLSVNDIVDWKRSAPYPAVSRVFTVKLYDWVQSNVFLIKTLPPVLQPFTWITYTNGGPFTFAFSIKEFLTLNIWIDDNRTIKLGSNIGSTKANSLLLLNINLE